MGGSQRTVYGTTGCHGIGQKELHTMDPRVPDLDRAAGEKPSRLSWQWTSPARRGRGHLVTGAE